MFVERSLISDRTSASHARRGAITLWMILIIPAIVLLFGVVVDMSRLWVARIELTNALEAAALSGVKTWGDLGNSLDTNRTAARNDAKTAFDANTVTGHGLLGLDLNVGAGTNDNGLPPNDDLLLGAVNSSVAPYTFQSDVVPVSGTHYFAVRAQQTDFTVSSIWGAPSWIFGSGLGPYQLTLSAVAIYDNGTPRIVHVTP